MKTLADDQLLAQFKIERNESFALLFKFYFPLIASYIKQNNGTPAEAEDIFEMEEHSQVKMALISLSLFLNRA